VLAAGDVATAAAWNVIANDVISFRNNSGVVPPSIGMCRQASASLANNTPTFITWTVEDWDTDTMGSAGSDTITIKTAGLYAVSVTIAMDGNAAGTRYLWLEKNSTSAGTQANSFLGARVGTPSSATETHLLISGVVNVAVNDTLRFSVFQNSGGALNICPNGLRREANIQVTMLGSTS
jgi:hypothetical protein